MMETELMQAGRALGYGQTAQDCPTTDKPYLSRLSDAADELNRIAGYIESFIGRCRGGISEGAKLSGPSPVPSGHLGQLDRLQDNLSRVDKLARELQSIG